MLPLVYFPLTLYSAEMLFGLLCASTSAIPVEENVHADPVVSLFTTSIQTSDEKCDQTTRRATELYKNANGECVSSPYCERKKAKSLCSAIVPDQWGGDGTATVASKECQLTCPQPEEPTKHFITKSDAGADCGRGCYEYDYECASGTASDIDERASKIPLAEYGKHTWYGRFPVGDGDCPNKITRALDRHVPYSMCLRNGQTSGYYGIGMHYKCLA